MSSTESVKVCIRVRPMNKKETDRGCESVVVVNKEYNQITHKKPNSGGMVKTFAFDSVYDESSSQREVYDETAFPLVESVIEGYNGTIFAYGQTGCGKTHTMLGIREDPDQKGIIPHAFDHIFGCIDEKEGSTKFLVRASYLEIYNEEIRDLLSKKGNSKLNLAEDKDKGIFVKGLTMIIVKSIPEIEKVMNEGTVNRKTAETKMNKESSRSHSIFTIYIETAEEDDKTGESRIKAGKLNLVDLAGSERQSKTGATGQTLKEATKINLSLSALGNVISALVDGKSSHIPYRDSKLTRLLQDSLGGNTKTVMIAALSPADYNYDETLSTLRYAARAKSIKNKPTVNEDPKDALLREYESEITRLKKLLEQANKGETITLKNLEDQFARNASFSNANLRVSIDKSQDKEDETVEYLLEKLKKKGKKIKVIGEEDEESDDLDRQKSEESPTKGDSKVSLEPSDPKEKASSEKEKLLKEKLKDTDKLDRAQLQKLIDKMETKLVHGGHGVEEGEKEHSRKIRQMQLRLKKERKKQKMLAKEKIEKEEKMLLVETKFKDAQEEADNYKELVNKLRTKYKAALEEIQDLEREHEQQREDLFDTIRTQEMELKLLNKINDIMLTPQEFYKIKSRSKYSEDKMEWKVPYFVVKNKRVALPSVNGKRAVEADKVDRDVHFGTDPEAKPNNVVEESHTLEPNKIALKPMGEMSFSPNRNDFKWNAKMLSPNNIEDSSKNLLNKKTHKRNNHSFVPMSGSDDPMIKDSRRAKYLRNNRFDEADNMMNNLNGLETSRIKRKAVANVSLAPLNHSAAPSIDEGTLPKTFRPKKL